MSQSGVSLQHPFGGSDSVFNSPGQIFGGPNSIFNKPFGDNSPPTPATPPAPPDPGTITQQALQGELQTELQLRRSNANPTGGAGVAASPTMSAGQMLVGF